MKKAYTIEGSSTPRRKSPAMCRLYCSTRCATRSTSLASVIGASTLLARGGPLGRGRTSSPLSAAAVLLPALSRVTGSRQNTIRVGDGLDHLWEFCRDLRHWLILLARQEGPHCRPSCSGRQQTSPNRHDQPITTTKEKSRKILSLVLPIHSIVQHIFEHVLPCRRTTLLFVREVSAIPVFSLLLQQKYVIRTLLCSIMASFGLHSL